MQENIPSLSEAVHAAYCNPELMREYRRLTGSTLGLDNRKPIDKMIDQATGFDAHEKEWTPFFEFVRDCVWLPVLATIMAENAAKLPAPQRPAK